MGKVKEYYFDLWEKRAHMARELMALAHQYDGAGVRDQRDLTIPISDALAKAAYNAARAAAAVCFWGDDCKVRPLDCIWERSHGDGYQSRAICGCGHAEVRHNDTRPSGAFTGSECLEIIDPAVPSEVASGMPGRTARYCSCDAFHYNARTDLSYYAV